MTLNANFHDVEKY